MTLPAQARTSSSLSEEEKKREKKKKRERRRKCAFVTLKLESLQRKTETRVELDVYLPVSAQILNITHV